MSPFLTVKEAGQLVGKSPSSIRRIIYPILENDHHPDRNQIEPTPEEATQFRLKGENFAWRISEELLRREVPLETVAPKGSGTVPERDRGEGNGALLEMLRRELDIKNGQITQQSDLISKQMELINGLSERLREGNILIGSLQKHLTLGDGKMAGDHAHTKDATVVSSVKTEPKVPKKPKPKGGIFKRLFS